MHPVWKLRRLTMAFRQPLVLGISLSLVTVALSAQGARGGAQGGGQPPAAPAAPMPIPKLVTEEHPDLSGIWNRIDSAGGGSYTGIGLTFPIAQLTPEYAAKLPAQQYGGVGAAPAGFVPPPYDINAQAPVATRCGVGGGGFNAGGGGINSIHPACR
jgi:hypothetical protein